MRRFIILTALICMLTSVVNGQQPYELYDGISVVEGGSGLAMPYAGGLNTPYYSTVDVNLDGTLELIAFDRFSHQAKYFEGNNAIGYTYRPEWNSLFPEVYYWAVLKDADCDGIKDVIGVTANNTLGVFKGAYNTDGLYEPAMTPLEFRDLTTNAGFTYVYDEDIPAVEDMDNDGDLDVVFTPDGFHFQLMENLSQDMGYGCDSLLLEIGDTCWGDFHRKTVAPFYELDSCQYSSTSNAAKSMHFQVSILALDMDADNDKDLLLSDLGNGIDFAENDGGISSAHIAAIAPNFPDYDVPADVNFQAACSYVDINTDGISDLLVSPTFSYESDKQTITQSYINTGAENAPVFTFDNGTFLVEDMVDGGDYTKLRFVDMTGDGLVDMMLTNYFVDGSANASIALFENVGTVTSPAFELTNDDFAGISAYGLEDLHADFKDLDADGDKDIILGEKEGGIYFFWNNAGSFMFDPLLSTIDIGQNSLPHLVDLDEDGDLDILAVRYPGQISYFDNIGTATSPDFDLESSIFLVINNAFTTDLNTRIDEDGTLVMYIVHDGMLSVYQNMYDDLPFGPATPYPSTITDELQHLPASISFADINNDGVDEFAIGTKLGGIGIYKDPCPKPNTVDLVAQVDGVDINWLGNADSYNIYYRSAGNATWSAPINTNALSYSLSLLQTCTDYELKIVSVCNGQEGGETEIVGFSTTPPDASWSLPLPIVTCAGAVDLDAFVTGTSGGVWSGSGIASNGIFNPSGYAPGFYTISYEFGSPVCASNTQNIEVIAGPTSSWSLPTLNIYECDLPIDLAANITGDTGGTWSNNDGYVNASGIFDPALSGVGSFNVSYTVGVGGCENATTQFITVLASPDPVWSVPMGLADCDLLIDLNDFVTGTTAGNWSGGSYVMASGVFDPSIAGTGVHTVNYTVGNGSCEQTQTQTITVEDTPDASWSTPFGLAECDAAVDLTSYISGDFGGLWTGGSYVSGSGVFDPANAGVGVHNVTYSVGDGSCEQTQSLSITVDQAPNASWATPSTDIQNCDDPIDLTPLITGDTGGSWSGGSYISVSGVLDPAGLTSGNYEVTYTLGTGVCTSAESHVITVIAAPDPSWSGTSIAQCIGTVDLNLGVAVTMGGTWSGSGVTATGLFDPTALAIGNYDITYTVGTGSCLSSETQSIEVSSSPNASWITFSLMSCDQAINLNTLVSGTPGGTWSGSSAITGTNTFDPTSLSSGVYALTYTIGTGSCTDVLTQDVNVNPCEIEVQLAGFLEGATDFGALEMNDELYQFDLIPIDQPYNASPWNYSGTESVTSIPNDVIDWVLVDLFLSTDSSLIDQRAGFLLKNGDVVDMDGISPLTFNNASVGESYFIALRHRNHLAVLTASPIIVPNNFVYDFRTANSQAAGLSQQKDMGIFYALRGGDANADGLLTVLDVNQYITESSLIQQYLKSDFTLEGTITIADFNLYNSNNSVIGNELIRY